MFDYWGFASIYRPLSYPFISLIDMNVKTPYQTKFFICQLSVVILIYIYSDDSVFIKVI